VAESSSSNTLILVLVAVGVVAWMLFSKAERTVRSVNTSNKETYTTGTAVSSVVTNLAPALGQFVSGLFSSGSSSSRDSSAGLTHGTAGGYGSSISYGDDFDDSEEYV